MYDVIFARPLFVGRFATLAAYTDSLSLSYAYTEIEYIRASFGRKRIRQFCVHVRIYFR